MALRKPSKTTISKAMKPAPTNDAIVSRTITLADYKPHPRNYNRHPDSQVSDIAESLQTFGQVKPVVVWREFIIAGHGVTLGAQKLGWTQLEARVLPSAWSQTKALAYLAADNELAKRGDPDQAQLAQIVKDIADAEGEALAKLAAGDAKALRDLMAQANPVEETTDAGELVDKAAELQEKWQCVKGDIWTAAGHFWVCGDCRDFGTWKKLLSAAHVEKVNGVFTSPPYAEQRKAQYGGVPTDKYVEWWAEVQANVRAHLAQDGSFFVNIKPHCENGERVLYVFDLVLAMRRQWAWKFVDELCWRKEGMPGVYGKRFRNDFEPIYHFALGDCKTNFDSVKKETKRLPTGSKSSNADYQGKGGDVFDGRIENGFALPGNVIDVHMDNLAGHAARFPLALPEFFIKAYSDTGDVWLDPFLGSGTSIVAAHRNQRRGLGIEMLEKYCAVICERIEKETGETPKRIATKDEGRGMKDEKAKAKRKGKS